MKLSAGKNTKEVYRAAFTLEYVSWDAPLGTGWAIYRVHAGKVVGPAIAEGRTFGPRSGQRAWRRMQKIAAERSL